MAATRGGGRGYYYEVEVLEEQGYLRVGFAGTSLDPKCVALGDDACSWGCYSGDGDGRHRYVYVEARVDWEAKRGLIHFDFGVDLIMDGGY